MSKHTPGPWSVQDQFLNVFTCSNGNSGLTIHLATVNPGQVKGGRAEAIANARLIAAAPDLLELVKAFVHQLEDSLEGLKHPVHGRFVRGITNCEILPDRKLTLADARAAIAKAERST